ncbi:sugar phosphate isomerase/epimerase family protein [Fictibacillus fluitans]|uniref:Sugar phosphate isomerase/epimerase family protein n=1 Tax=Fictibacillus fluitans TaxID=3058422 RepID=A0ABT8HTG6_9BACL|nr:sugar phosphate isomerase/epimerase family protein [Fictibacillus sp. NE201]MDN4524067.1 sugar phosphate isomerase/epimerase family protein [Fictibacillus sp. NE201]
MKLGCCTTIDNSAIAKNAGFDFLECTVVSLVPENDDEFPAILERYQDCGLPVEACNIFLPGSLKVTGEHVNISSVERYVEKALLRVKQIGADTIVFGSGGARSLPEGFSREKGQEQIVQFLGLVANYSDSLGITIVIEPLNQKESNIINSVPEAVEIAKRVNRPSIKVLADFYHMDEENEPLEHLVSEKDYIRHIHVADSGRRAPGTGTYPYDRFVSCLSGAGYNGRISIECQWQDFEAEAAAARQFLSSVLYSGKV